MNPRLVSLLLACTLIAGCATQRALEEAQALIERDQVEDGIARLEEAVRVDPRDRSARQAAVRTRELFVARWLIEGEEARQRGQTDLARARFRRALALDPASERARAGLEQVARDESARAALAAADALLAKGDLEGAYARAREAVASSPGLGEARALLRRIEERAVGAAPAQLRAALRKPVSLELRATPLRMAFDLLARSAGLNFVFDRDVKTDVPVTITVTDTPIEEVVRFILLTNQLEQRVLNDRSLLVYPNTAAKNREYQELVVRTFFLGTADPKAALNLIRTVLKTRDAFVDEKLNMLVIRDTADAVRMAEKLISNQDRAEPEVMLELEVLEVARSDLLELGARFPEQIAFSIAGAAGTGGQLTLPEWLNRNAGLVRLSISNPALVLNFRNQLTRANLLANPRIRVKSREKARVHIGDKVPVITTTSTATGFVSEAVSYVDVGLKLDVEPIVHIEEEVGMRVNLEVSNIVDQTRTQSGSIAYRIGTRNAGTVLRLKDGETQVLAGLISDEERAGASRVPGIGQIPVVGRLFGSQLDQSSRTEIMLLVTPRVVRPLMRPAPRDLEFSAGTEAAVGARLLFPAAIDATPAAGAASPSIATAAAPAAIGFAPPAIATPAPAQATGAPTTQGAAVTPGVVTYLSAPERVKQGEIFVVTLDVSSPAEFRGLRGRIGFEPLHFNVEAIEPGPLLRAVAPMPALQSTAGAGVLDLSVESAAVISGRGTVATLRLRALGTAGRSALRLDEVRLTGAAGQVLLPAPTQPPLVTIAQ